MVLLQDSFEEETNCIRIHKRKLTTASIYSCPIQVMGQWHKNWALRDALDWITTGLNGVLRYEWHYIQITYTSFKQVKTRHEPYEEVELQLHTFLASASASHLVCFSLYMLWIGGWISPKGPSDMEKRKITSPPGVELQSSSPYIDRTAVQNDLFKTRCVLAVLFTCLFTVYLQTSNWAIHCQVTMSVNSETELTWKEVVVT